MNAREEITGQTKEQCKSLFWVRNHKPVRPYQSNVLPVTRGTKTKRLDMHQTESKLKFLVNARDKTWHSQTILERSRRDSHLVCYWLHLFLSLDLKIIMCISQSMDLGVQTTLAFLSRKLAVLCNSVCIEVASFLSNPSSLLFDFAYRTN